MHSPFHVSAKQQCAMVCHHERIISALYMARHGFCQLSASRGGIGDDLHGAAKETYLFIE